MLHNSGPYGPNDVPINMGVPVNRTQISNPVSIGNNLSNLGKMPPQVPQAAPPQYNMPDYSTFGHPPLNMGHPISPFANYQPMNFQTNYGHPGVNLPHESSLNNVQNGMLPMNLNIQSNHSPNLLNYHSDDNKRTDLNNSNFRDNYSRKMPINVPEIHKAFHKNLATESSYSQYTSIQENPYYRQDSSKTPERTLLDSNRRKSLENTVKLIENILSNTAKEKLRSTNVESTGRQNVIMNVPTVENLKKIGAHKTFSDQTINDTPNTSTNDEEIKNMVTNTNSAEVDQSRDSHLIKALKRPINTNQTNEDLPNGVQSEPLNCHLLSSTNAETNKILSETSENDTDSSSDTPLIKEEIVDEETSHNVKLELVTTWTRSVNVQPFLRDTNATDRDDAGKDAVIIAGDNNITQAMEAAKNGHVPNTYYECPHCNLLFKHPKRLIIHTKWHTFGLTNEKRQELAKEKEIRRTLKREARITERLHFNEMKNKEDAEGNTHPCKDCDKVFKMKSSLKNHRQRYHPTRVRECKICHASVVGWLALREHVTAHAGAAHACPDCPKRFKYAHSLAKHKDTHLEKTHGCEQCEKKFGSKALLKMHMKCHERTARGATFRCTYCGKGFFESYNLQVHERTHRNERPFLCDICQSSFGTNSSLKRHLKVSHSSLKPFPCPTCQRCFATASTRARHGARAHGDPAALRHACARCPRRYRAHKDLAKHRARAHPDHDLDHQI